VGCRGFGGCGWGCWGRYDDVKRSGDRTVQEENDDRHIH